jgi:hypothetical protein
MQFTAGDRVQIASPGSQHGKVGTIVRLYPGEDRPYLVRFDGEDRAAWTCDDLDIGLTA